MSPIPSPGWGLLPPSKMPAKPNIFINTKYLYFILNIYTYSEFLVELVGLMVKVVDGDGDQVFVSVVVAPVDRARGECDDVAAADAVHLLMRVSAELLSSFLALVGSLSLSAVVGLSAPRKDYADESLTCSKCNVM